MIYSRASTGSQQFYQSLITKSELMLKLKKYTKKVIAGKGPQIRAFWSSRSHLKDLYRSSLNSVMPITEPLVLISQIQRSGGTLMSQLLDGHPEIYAHPDELKMGYPKKYIWPRIDLADSPKHWFNILFEETAVKHFREGYKKGHKSDKTFPFLFLIALQKKIFFKYLDSLDSVTHREIFNAYMTSYFGSWLNYHNAYGAKKIITGFTPRLSMSEENMEFFFEVYPDGRLISIIRDPRNWYPSASRHGSKKYSELKKAITQWNENAEAMLKNKDRYKNRVIIISFEDLIKNTQAVMRLLAEYLEIEFDDILLVPTFNRFLMVANTSFQSETAGIVHNSLVRYKTLTHEELDVIDNMTRDNYQNVLNIADLSE